MAGARRLSAVDQGWPLARPFAISRGVKTEARVVVCEVEDADGQAGRGECVPYARYGETVDIVPGVWLVRARTTASALRNDLSHLLDREDRLFVVDASRDRSAWFNFASEADAKVRGLWRGNESG